MKNTPTNSSELSPLGGAPAPGLSQGHAPAAPAPGRQVGGMSTIREGIGSGRGSFRTHSQEVNEAKKAFSQSRLVMNSNILVGSAGAVNRGTPKVSPKGDQVVFPTLDDYRRDFDMRAPKAVKKAIQEALEQGRFQTVGFDNHLQKAISLPALMGFNEVTAPLLPSKVGDYARTSAARDYRALNEACPVPAVGDGRLTIAPVVFNGPEGRREVFGFRNGSKVAVVNQQGNEIEVVGKVEFHPAPNRKLARSVPSDGVVATFPWSVPAEDGPAMLNKMAQMGWSPISTPPTPRGDLPPGVREKGAITLAAEGIMRVARGVAAGAMGRALNEPTELKSELDQEMAEGWDIVKMGLIQSGLVEDMARKSMGYAASVLTSLANMETAFLNTIQSDGAHRDASFRIKEFLIKRFGIDKDTTTIGSVPLDKIRDILTDRSTDDLASDSFGAAAQQSTVARAKKLDQIHEAIVELLPELILRDANGQPQRAMEEQVNMKDGQQPVSELVPAMWSDPNGRSNRPRFHTELDAVLAESHAATKELTVAAKAFDRSIQTAKLNLASRMMMVANSNGPMVVPDTARFHRVAVAICNRNEVSREDRTWFDSAMAAIRMRVPGLVELERTYVDGALAASIQTKINDKEAERSAFAAGRIIEGRNPSALDAHPTATYAMPPSPTGWVTVLPENKELTRFTAYENKREVDGDFLGSEKDIQVEAGMDLDRTLAFMRERSSLQNRVCFAASPRSEFVAPRDNRGFPVLTPGQAPIRVTTTQEQIAHARRLPIFSAPDAHDSLTPHIFSLQGVQVDVVRGKTQALFAPGAYIPIFLLSQDGKDSIPRLPDHFGNINQAADEISFTIENRDRNRVRQALLRAYPDRWEENALKNTLDSLYSRSGRYTYPNMTFREGADAYALQRSASIEVMAAYAVVMARAKRPAGLVAGSDAAVQVDATIAAREREINTEAAEHLEGVEFVHGLAKRDADLFEGRKVSGLVTLVGDGTGEMGHNWLLAWESVDEMLHGERSLTALQSRGVLPGRVIKSRLD